MGQVKSEDKANYPEHQKLMDNKNEHEHIQRFLRWLEHNGYFVGEYIGEGLEHVRQRPETLISEYYDVDPKKLEDEKREMIEKLRS